MMEREILSIKNKALSINLNPRFYGTLAEIGGGQEVARAFFQAGGASGTIAKSISAYDKTFSDFIYNKKKPGRYVSEERLMLMLEKEYSELIITLEEKMGNKTCFFAYANTVVTLNYNKDNQGHGWMGMRFQLAPEKDPNQVILHVNLLENDTLLQQYTLGALGVNLVFACIHFHDRPNIFIQSLMDNLDRDRIEINMLRMSGPDLSYVDNRLLSVQLVKNGMTSATMFDATGRVQQPDDMLYKKNVLAFRGRFRPITTVGFDMLQTSYDLFGRDEDYSPENTISLCEITLNNLMQEGSLDERDFLDRVNLLNELGQNVMISNFREYYKLVSYFSRFKIKKLRIVIGIPTFINVWKKEYYTELKGGILEAFGKLFTQNMKLYVYPSIKRGSEEILTTRNIDQPDELKHLYQHLIANKFIIDVQPSKLESLKINSERVLELIQNGDPDWENCVPEKVAQYVKKNKVFGYKQANL